MAYSGFHVFGDSLVDAGNQSDEAVPDLDGQTDAFRKSVGGDADSGALYFMTMGGSDIRNMAPHNNDPISQLDATQAMQRAAPELHQEIEQLIEIGVTPASGSFGSISAAEY